MIPARSADVCIVGFGFAGLATAAHLVRERPDLRITVVAPDTSGLGLAYGTRDTSHLLNVRAERMGAWADALGDFCRWLTTPAAAAACRRLGVEVPGPADFAPRALYARYLGALRDATFARATALDVVSETVTALRPAAGGWTVEAGDAHLRARCCVLAVGHEPRTVLDAPAVHRGPWSLPAVELGAGPAVIAGTGLTAVDSILTLRGLGFDGQIVAASRTGLLPRRHGPHHPPAPLCPDRVAGLRGPDDVRALLAGAGDWRRAMDGLRPHTQAVWRRFSPAAQREVAERWTGTWGAHRHRMAPAIADRVDAELEAGTLRVVAGRVALGADPAAHDGEAGRFGRRCPAVTVGGERLQPSVLVDCTGGTLDWAGSGRPLLRGLVADGHCTPHHTGLGVTAGPGHAIGPGLHAVGSALTGELWESIAVPELREQAATVAAAVTAAPVAPAAVVA